MTDPAATRSDPMRIGMQGVQHLRKPKRLVIGKARSQR
jgi:hypothetical protein